MTPEKKLITVVGATGAQGSHVVEALLAPSPDGSPSPYAVRALSRDPTSVRARQLSELGVEVVQGSFMDFKSVAAAFRGAYGAFVNTDGFTVGDQAEIFAGMRIFELAKQAHIKHYVWGSLEYGLKKGGYDEKYRCDHFDAKGRVAEWLKAQPSEETGLTWSVLTSGPYMDMLSFYMFGPLNQRDDGTVVFASPIGSGHVPMVSLNDLGYFARYIYDHPRQTSAKNLEIASDTVDWERLVATFSRVTGQKAVYLPQTLDEWFENFTGVDKPVAKDFYEGFTHGLHKDKTSWKKNFTGWWNLLRDDIMKRDMAWVRKINPGTEDIEAWMRRVKYDGSQQAILKAAEDAQKVGSGVKINVNKTRLL